MILSSTKPAICLVSNTVETKKTRSHIFDNSFSNSLSNSLFALAFDKSVSCEVNDFVDDTPLGSPDIKPCNAGGRDVCGTLNPRIDYSNLMSYGTCRTGTPLTHGQLRLTRTYLSFRFVSLSRRVVVTMCAKKHRLFHRERHVAHTQAAVGVADRQSADAATACSPQQVSIDRCLVYCLMMAFWKQIKAT